jgi:hypothetical protein
LDQLVENRDNLPSVNFNALNLVRKTCKLKCAYSAWILVAKLIGDISQWCFVPKPYLSHIRLKIAHLAVLNALMQNLVSGQDSVGRWDHSHVRVALLTFKAFLTFHGSQTFS